MLVSWAISIVYIHASTKAFVLNPIKFLALHSR